MKRIALSAATQHKRQHLAARLRELAATLAPGERLPSAAELESRFAVSTTTVDAAMRLLLEEGVIVRRQGSGTFVAERMTTAREAVVVLSLYSGNSHFRHFSNHLAVQCEKQGLSAVCRYDDDHLTLADVLLMEKLEPRGFLVVGWELEWAARGLMGRGHRVVLFANPLPGQTTPVPLVHGDNELGGYRATQHLIELGHERMVFLHPFRMENGGSVWDKWRWAGHLRALREANLNSQAAPMLATNHVTEAVSWLSSPGGPTALIAWSDDFAFQAARALHDAGKSVPQAASIIGYDNLPIGRHAVPALDTVDPHMDEQARLGFELLWQDEAPQEGTRLIVEPTVIERASCALKPPA